MSVFCTEVMDFWMEVWERPPAPDVPDPLKLLYNGHAELLGRVIGRPLNRVLNFLYDDVAVESDVRWQPDPDAAAVENRLNRQRMLL
jgi:hypothetical protein